MSSAPGFVGGVYFSKCRWEGLSSWCLWTAFSSCKRVYDSFLHKLSFHQLCVFYTAIQPFEHERTTLPYDAVSFDLVLKGLIKGQAFIPTGRIGEIKFRITFSILTTILLLLRVIIRSLIGGAEMPVTGSGDCCVSPSTKLKTVGPLTRVNTNKEQHLTLWSPLMFCKTSYMLSSHHQLHNKNKQRPRDPQYIPVMISSL